MTDFDKGPLHGRTASNRIRLRTLILLRWFAIAGQLTAITVAQQLYHLQLYLGFCYLVVGISVAANLLAIIVFPENKRLTETEIFLMVMFDLLLLALLLYLTGGVNNPFAVFLVGPVTISASVMTLRSTVMIGSMSIILITFLAQYYMPLRTEQGQILSIADVFLFGQWAAIVIAIIFMGAYSRRISSELHSMNNALAATQMALSREQKLTDLAGVVAAAAHELGTPLATIKLASGELIEELEHLPELREDAQLIREQTDRCRDIMRDMGRAGKDDLHLHQAPLSAVVGEAAEPHICRGKELHFETNPMPGTSKQQPSVLRKPEIIHGLRNLIQNGVDFARANVWVEAAWNADTISVRIVDDGFGYPPQMIGRIGDPFRRLRRNESDRKVRPEYDGMGLGLFIAKTLLERSGAALRFANGSDPVRCGAIVEVTWPRVKIDAQLGENAVQIGLNRPIGT